ncbi:MAG: hypothetical protein FWD76_03350, partial [Firmicutes bacterium]|nr:hypothetical protein [Bacillota bacterium]
MAEVARNIDEATAKVKGFTQEIKSAETELRALDKALKVDPSNVDLVTQKYNTLANQLALNEEKAQALKDQIANLKAEWDNGDISQETYEKNLKKLEQQLVLTEIETTRLTASVSQQNEVMQNLSVDDFTSGLSKAEGVTTSLDTAEKKMTFSTLTKGLRDAKKEASNFMSAVGFLSSALSTSLNLINKWGEMDALTKILSTLSIVAT